MTAGRMISNKVLAAAGALVFAVAPLFLILTTTFTGIKPLGLVQYWSIVLALVLLWFVLPSKFRSVRWPITLRSSILIDAPLSAVWHRVLPHPGRKHFCRDVIEILGDESDPDHFSLRLDPEGRGEVPLLQLHVEQVIDHAFLRIAYLNADACPIWSRDLTGSEYIVEREGICTRLTVVERLDKIRVSTLASILFLSPCKRSAARVKTLCEGCSETSSLARMIDSTPNVNNGWERVSNRGGLWLCTGMAIFSLLVAWSFI